MTQAAFTIVTVKRPSGKKTGLVRMVIAHLNKARFDTDFGRSEGRYVQSFAPCHRIHESSDYNPALLTPEKIAAYKKRVCDWNKIHSLQDFL